MPADVPATKPADHWNWTTAQALAAFEAEHGTTPQADWTDVDYDTWTNLHLATAA